MDVGHMHPTGENILSLLSHAIGVQVRKYLPMHHGYWRKVDPLKKDEAIRSLMSYFDFETNEDGRLESGISEYVEKQFAKLFHEFKCDLYVYFQDLSPDEVKSHPPLEWENREDEDWITMCDHFLSDRFQKQSKANTENRGKKQYNHHGGSKPMSLRYENHVKNGEQFPEIETFKESYTNENGEWTDDAVKKKYDEMLSKRDALLKKLAVGYPEGTSVEEIIAPDDASRNILMETLGTRPGREIRGLGFGMYRDLRSSSSIIASSVHFKDLGQQLATEKKARLDMETIICRKDI